MRDQSVAEHGTSVILSSHLISDLERVCDYLVVLAASRLQLAAEVADITATHHRIVCSRRQPDALPAGLEVVHGEHTDRQSTFIVRTADAPPKGDWAVEPLGLEDLVLTYMERETTSGPRPTAPSPEAAR